jgi:hypothetical protein
MLVLPPALFVALTCVRLDAQGLYYDEVHQATGAFAYRGSPPEYFARFTVRGIPVLNMSYSGAIKTAVYGMYLRASDAQFGVVSWRLVGIALVAVGLVVFVWLVHARFSPASLAVVLALLITDQMVLLGVRHDWGPIALALALRLALIAVWLRGDDADRVSVANTIALGVLVGLMIFEKLSSVVLLVALAAIVLSDRRRRTLAHGLALFGGLAVGLLPLLLVNLSSWLTQGRLISLNYAGAWPQHSWYLALRHAWGYAGLGAGEYVRRFILGSNAPAPTGSVEPFLLGFALLLAGTAVLLRRDERGARAALAALGSYVGIALALYLLPRRAWLHHWIIGTPFQYVAIGLALDSSRRTVASASAYVGAARRVLPLVVAVLLVMRLAGVISLERALWRGDAARQWHASLTELGHFAAARADEAIFVAADWGVATQIYCLANGRPGLVYEPFWAYDGPADLLRLQRQSGATVMYAVAPNPPSDVRPATTTRIFDDLSSAPYWREAPVEAEAARLTAVTIRKFLADAPRR